MGKAPCVTLSPARVVDGQLYAPGRNETLSLGSSMWSRFKTVRVKPPPAHLAALPCTVTHERAVFGAVPGNTGCRQMSHTFFNWLMPTWHTLNKSGWSDPAVFVDCTGRPPSGINQRSHGRT